MGQFLPPKGQLLPATIADVKTRLRRVEHQIEKVNAKPTDTGGIEVTFSATLPNSAAVGDVWYKTSGNSVIAQYQAVTAYSAGNGSQSDWAAYTTDGSAITPQTVANAQLAEAAVDTPNLAPQAVTSAAMAPAAVTLDAIDASSVTARTLGGAIVTFSQTEPANPQNGDMWVETDASGAVTSMWSRSGTVWVEATIAESTAQGVKVTASATAPLSPNDGDLWINQSQGNLLEQWSASGAKWNTYQYGSGAIANNAVGNAQLASNAVANANLQANAVANGNLQNGAVDVTKVASAKIGPVPSTVASQNSGSAVTSFAVTCTKAVPAGTNLVVGIGGYNVPLANISITDSQNNMYVPVTSNINNSEPIWVFQSLTGTALSTTDTITIASDTAQVLNLIAIMTPNSTIVDVCASANGNSTTMSATIPSLNYPLSYVIGFEHNSTNTPTWSSPAVSLGTTSGGGGGFFTSSYTATSTVDNAVTVTATESAATVWTMSAVAVPSSTGIGTPQLAQNSVGTPNMQPGSVDGNVLAQSSVGSNHVQAGAIGSNHLSQGALDNSDVNNLSINSGTISASDFIISPGTSNGLFAYGTPPSTSFSVSITGSGSWTCPLGVSSATIELWGAGGGGAGGTVISASNYRGGPGGGGGAYVKKTFTVVPGTKYNYNIGTGGTGGPSQWPTANSSAGTGKKGGDSSITVGSVTLTATGGSGGVGYDGNYSHTAIGGKGAPVSSNADVSYPGGDGGSTGTGQGAGGGSSAGNAAAGNPGQNGGHNVGGTGAAPPVFGGSGGNGDYYQPADGSQVIGRGTPGATPGGGGGGGRGTGYTSPQMINNGMSGGNGQIRISYSVAPGTTPQLLASLVATGGADPFGQTVYDGYTTYIGKARLQVHTNQANGCPAIEMYTGQASEQLHPSIYTLPVNPGLANESETLYLQGPASAYDGQSAHIELQANHNDGSYQPYIVFSVGGNLMAYFAADGAHFNNALYGSSGSILTDDVVAQDPSASKGTKETWHGLGAATGWGKSNAGVGTGANGFYYKKLPMNMVAIAVDLTTANTINAGNASTCIASGSIPVAYRPATPVNTGMCGVIGNSSTPTVYLTINTDGSVNCQVRGAGSLVAGANISGTFFYPLGTLPGGV